MKIIAALLAILLLSGCTADSELIKTEREIAGTAGYIKISGTGPAPELRIGCGGLSGNFSDLWAETDGDRITAGLVELKLLTVDRRGEVLYSSAQGEIREYEGRDYEYFGAADLEIELTETGGAVYVWRLRKDICFSDGSLLTADDVIFSFAAACDRAFEGNSGPGTLDITGLEQYLTGTDDEIYEKYRGLAEKYLKNPSKSPDETERWFYETAIPMAWENECRHIVKYCGSFAEKYGEDMGYTADEIRGSEALSCAFAMYIWGFGEFRDGILTGLGTGESREPETVDMAMLVREARALYKDADEFFRLEGTGKERESITEFAVREFISRWGGAEQAKKGENVSIKGIEKRGEYTVAVYTDTYRASDVFSMDIPILPLHYYGDPAEFNPNEGRYGFKKGDLNGIREKSSAPLGAGPYRLKSFDGDTAVLAANRYYFREAPATSIVKVKAAGGSAVGIRTDEYDMCFQAYTDTRTDASVFENAGYGYIGINAERVKVGDDAFSDRSRSLRTALGAVISACRGRAAAYYGDLARETVTRIGSDSWAYCGGGIEYEEADALAAAIGFLRGAGFTWDARQCIFTEAPDGASLSYTITIPADGKGAHPACKAAARASEMLKKIGIELRINDPEDADDLVSALENGSAELWAAAWTGTQDPDIYQIFSSNNIPGQGTGLNYFRLKNAELDELLLKARETADHDARRKLYERASLLIDRETVEIPLYRKLDAVYFGNRVDRESVEPATAYFSPINIVERVKIR